MSRRLEILWNVWANRRDLNAQSLTARELARRLPAERFHSRFFLEPGDPPDPRLVEAVEEGRAAIDWVTMPRRLGTLRIVRELLWGGHDLLFYPALNPRASRLYRRLRWLGGKVAVVNSIEASWPQLEALPAEDLGHTLEWARRSDFCAAITPQIAESLGRRGIQAEVVPLGVDLECFRPPEPEMRESDRPLKVIFVASIQPRKQPHLVLELARRLGGEAVEFHLVGPVLGDPAYHRRLLEEKARDGLDQVYFHGPLPQTEIRDWLARSHVYVLPSRLEGFGKTTLEAAACGLPAVIFDDYGSTSVVDGETGFQVSTFDEMEEKVRQLLGDPTLRRRLGRAAVAHAHGFDWAVLAERWRGIFERSCSASAAPGQGP